MKILTADIETNGFLEETTRMWCHCAKDYSTGEVYKYKLDECAEGLKFYESADILVFHNGINFDEPAIKKLYPHIKLPKTIDTLVISRLIWPDIQDQEGIGNENVPDDLKASHSLKAWGYRLGVLKGSFGEEQGFSEWNPEMLDYCAQDAEVTHLLLKLIASKNYSKEAVAIEHDFARIIFKQTESGFCFDMEKATKLKEELEEKKETLAKTLQAEIAPKVILSKKPSVWHYPIEGGYISNKTKGGLEKLVRQLKPEVKLKDIKNTIIAGQPTATVIPFNPSSAQQRAKFLTNKYGWFPEDFTETGQPKSDYDVLKRLDYPLAKPLMEYMKVDKIYGMLVGSGKGNSVPWLDMLGDDGRIHGFVNPCGTVTGRVTMSKPNMGQIPSVKVNKKTGELIYGLEGGYGADCRSLFTVPEGMVQVGCDASGQELRNLSHYLFPFDKGEYVNEILKGDIHIKNQTVAELETRDEAKTFIYSFLYGCGPLITGFAVSGDDLDRFAGTEYEDRARAYLDKNPIIVNGKRMVKKKKGHLVLLTDEIYLRAAKGMAVQEKFRSNLKGFQPLLDSIAREVKANRLTGLDGRLYSVRSEHKGLNIKLQGAGAVQMKKATKLHYDRMVENGYEYDKDWFFSANVYDETQQAVREDLAEFAGESMRLAFKEAGEYFKLNCPMDGEYKIGQNWSDCH